MHALTQARNRYNLLVDIRDAALQDLETIGDDATMEEARRLVSVAEAAQADVERARAEVDRLEVVAEARAASPLFGDPVNQHSTTSTTSVGANYALPRGGLREEPAYRPDRTETSFFRDMLSARTGDQDARHRLDRNREIALDDYRSKLGVDYRDMSNTATAGAEFVPTVYLNDLWVEPSIAGRPFVDSLPRYPLPVSGTTLSLPKLSSGVAVAARSDGGSVQETDGVTASVTFNVNEYSGQVDVGRAVVYRSEPGFDMVIGRTLLRRYNAAVDVDALSGSGTAPHHKGLDNTTSPNTTTYTDSTPTQAELLGKLYSAVADIGTNRSGEVQADMIVLHPRRAAWLAAGLSSTFPLFQQGAYVQAAGGQDAGYVINPLGLREVVDANITVTAGASTNEDKIYILASSDFYWAEGPIYSRVFEDVGSGTGLIRFQLFAWSAFLSDRYPKSLSILSGTGLAAPSF